jgi:hypothetical protein
MDAFLSFVAGPAAVERLAADSSNLLDGEGRVMALVDEPHMPAGEPNS